MHVASVWDGTALSFFLNGKRHEFKTDGRRQFARELPGGLQGSNFPFFVGADPGGYVKWKDINRLFAGQIDEVRISNIARYTNDFKPAARFEPDEHTLALYHFDEGAGDVLKDSSGNGHHGKIVGATWVKGADLGPAIPTWQPTPEQQAFLDQVAKLPAEKQLEAVGQKLKDANPGFDGTLWHKLADGQIILLSLSTDHITELWPVRALPHLQSLEINGSGGPNGTERNGMLTDLSPLAGMPLTAHPPVP